MAPKSSHSKHRDSFSSPLSSLLDVPTQTPVPWRYSGLVVCLVNFGLRAAFRWDSYVPGNQRKEGVRVWMFWTTESYCGGHCEPPLFGNFSSVDILFPSNLFSPGGNLPLPGPHFDPQGGCFCPVWIFYFCLSSLTLTEKAATPLRGVLCRRDNLCPRGRVSGWKFVMCR